jgi:HAD superfamily hydrolase (TIGR01548 family)
LSIAHFLLKERPFVMMATTLLLDMDGVLAEVSKSYRAAIVETCHSFGATSVDLQLISEWKARGGCNNDWVLSLDLIHQDELGRKDVSLEEVTETFERLYQGYGDQPGLCELETLIPSVSTLEELHRRSQGRMAIVTGRPHKDCIKFLETHNLAHLFKAHACMEDGPPKPDPFPVQRACELLGVSPGPHVIMVGDTPDDIRAAVSCGCVGVGVATPEAVLELAPQGKSHEETQLAVAMKDCGASIVLEPGFEALIDMFPENS